MLSADMSPRLFEEIFRLVQEGHVKPIHPVRDPVHIFGSGEIIPALSRTSRGKHTGKIVVSHW